MLDEFIKDKFLEDIQELLNQYKIEDNIELLQNICRNLLFKEYSNRFREDFRKIYINLYKRNFAILEVLATKQKIEIDRLVFSVVRNNISTTNTNITWPNIINVFISHKNQELIQHPDPKKLFPDYEPAI